MTESELTWTELILEEEAGLVEASLWLMNAQFRRREFRSARTCCPKTPHSETCCHVAFPPRVGQNSKLMKAVKTQEKSPANSEVRRSSHRFLLTQFEPLAPCQTTRSLMIFSPTLPLRNQRSNTPHR